MTGLAPERFAFWDWSLRVYARPAVMAACLELQDRQGLDVNLLLFGLWLAIDGRSLGGDVASAAARLDRLATDAQRWHADVVRPLRAARRTMKRAGEGFDQSPGQQNPGQRAGPDECAGPGQRAALGQDLGAEAAALRARLQAIELDAERVEQWLLFLAAGSLPALPSDEGSTIDGDPVLATRASRHLDAVAMLAGVQWGDQDRPALAVLVAAAGDATARDPSD